jgi:cyanate permease
MKYIITIIVIASFSSIIYGFSLDSDQEAIANKYIGGGTVGLFLLAMPLFLYKESKGKKMDDYLLTEENVRKMQGKPPKKTDNQ